MLAFITRNNQRKIYSKSYKAKPISWIEIRQNYHDLILNHNWNFEKMLLLVDFIIQSKVSERLFAHLSHDILILSIYEDFAQELVRIQYYPPNDEFYFEYIEDYNFLNSKWERKYKSTEINDKFMAFINKVKW